MRRRGLPSPGGGTSAGTDTSRMQDSERYANCKTGDDANSDEDCARVAVENSLVDYWAEALPGQSDTQFSPRR